MDRMKECAQDIRERELLEKGYVQAENVFFRLGRAIFIITTTPIEYSQEDARGTIIGQAASLSNPFVKFKKEHVELMQELCGSTGYLRINVEGDPDAGLSLEPDKVLISGYRFGIDDVIVNGKLLDSTHGSREEMMRNYADAIELNKFMARVPDWDTFDGACYYMKQSPELKAQIEQVVESIRGLANTLEHKDDMPEEVMRKWKVKIEEMIKETDACEAGG